MLAYVFIGLVALNTLLAILTLILLRRITMTEDELALTLGGISDGLTAVGDQLAKATDEIIAALHAQTGTTSPAVDAAVNKLTTIGAALKAAAQTLDDLNADVVPPPAPPPVEPPAEPPAQP